MHNALIFRSYLDLDLRDPSVSLGKELARLLGYYFRLQGLLSERITPITGYEPLIADIAVYDR